MYYKSGDSYTLKTSSLIYNKWLMNSRPLLSWPSLLSLTCRIMSSTAYTILQQSLRTGSTVALDHNSSGHVAVLWWHDSNPCFHLLQEVRGQLEENIKEVSSCPSNEAPILVQSRAGQGGGPGLYNVVKTGPSGHNIRSCPNLRGIPIGMLVLGNKVKAIGEVRTHPQTMHCVFCGRVSINQTVKIK